MAGLPEINRDKSGNANWKHEYDKIFDVFSSNRRDYDAARRSLMGSMAILLTIRQEAKKDGNYELADRIRDHLARYSVEIKDDEKGTSWGVEISLVGGRQDFC